MEPNELKTIRESGNPYFELLLFLEHRGLDAADAVQTGLLTNQQIHKYVVFCMKEMVGEIKRILGAGSSFTTFVVDRAVDSKERWVNGGCRSEVDSVLTETTGGMTKLSAALRESCCGVESIRVSALVENLLGCMSTDPYMAHAHTFPVAVESKGVLDEGASLGRRRQWMINLLRDSPRTEPDVAVSCLSGEVKDRGSKKGRSKKKAETTNDTKNAMLQSLVKARVKKSDW